MVPAKIRVPRVRALRRERLNSLLGRLWDCHLGLVVAPAGSGKTTLLADFAADVGAKVAWYRAESWDGEVRPLLDHLREAFGEVTDEVPGRWTTVEMALRSLETWRGERLLLVVDDLHTLEGTPAEVALERFIDYAPESIAVLVGSRTIPRFNLSRLRISGRVLEIGNDDLRFRSWEAERLFREIYGLNLAPEELAELTRRTEGWAAGLQLFHLAVRGRTSTDARHLLTALGTRSRLQREYLTRNVLDDLPDELRIFLVETCVLTRLSGPICDRFLGTKGSGRLLEELERRQIFTHELGEGNYRYHEILRRHLEALVLEEAGETVLRTKYRHAGIVLEAAGAITDALSAYSRGGDWHAVHRVLQAQGRQLEQGAPEWVLNAPRSVVENDPWLLLALARRQRAEGKWSSAVSAYGQAQLAFMSSEGRAICSREREGITCWFDSRPPSATATSWSTAVRAAVSRDQSSVMDHLVRLADAERSLALGLTKLATGRVSEARPALVTAAESASATPAQRIGARIGASVAGLLGSGSDQTTELEDAADAAEALGLSWLARLGRCALALGKDPDVVGDTRAMASTFEAGGDVWGAGLALLCHCWAGLLAGAETYGTAVEAAHHFHSLRAPVIESWALALGALAEARRHEPSARVSALAAERMARSRGCLGARLIAHAALVDCDPEAAHEHRRLVEALEAQSGLHIPTSMTSHRLTDSGRVHIRCLGSFAFLRDGQEVDLSTLKPRARALLRLLSVNAGRPVHKEALQEALWPQAGLAGAHNLQVAVSALRQVLEPGVMRGQHSIVFREGEAYRLALPAGSSLDFIEFENKLASARRATAIDQQISMREAALALYTGDLLPQDGPAEWVVNRREELKSSAVSGYREVAELRLKSGNAGGAAEAAHAGLRLDRYQDGLWRILIRALEEAADRSAASRARTQYQDMLSELGVLTAEPVRR